ncbi:unnamed protein product [Rangifer tarandus platyrhynchus]|uniref:Uncharacterized protein n=1 Tax=Rangifer tarandus platyrhynchus TaxID=3082113 RepID=A0AC59Z2M7_RANTA
MAWTVGWGGSPWLGCGRPGRAAGQGRTFSVLGVDTGQSHLPGGSSGSSLPPQVGGLREAPGGQGHKLGGGRTGKGAQSQGRGERLSTSGDPSKVSAHVPGKGACVFPGRRFLEDVFGEAGRPGLGLERKPGSGGGEKSNAGSGREPRLLRGHPKVEVGGVTRPHSRLRCAESAVTCSTPQVCSDSQKEDKLQSRGPPVTLGPECQSHGLEV